MGNDNVSGIQSGGGDASAAQEVLDGIDAILVAARLATDEMRDWVQLDLATPGAIIRAISEHQMVQEEAAIQHIPDQ